MRDEFDLYVWRGLAWIIGLSTLAWLVIGVVVWGLSHG